jgi:TolB-like protein/thioredoxin-like negative regulator of GroEL
MVVLASILFRMWHLQRISAEKRAQAVAVLPFLNLTGNSDQDYLSDGITEEITGGLAATRSLRVVARTSSFRFKSNDVDVRQIGNQLNVSSIVEGSVQSSGDSLEIAVHLVRVPDGYQIWSATYHRGRANLSSVENEICDSLARALVSGANAQVRSVDAQAHELYLRGRYSLNRRSPSEVKTAINFFNQALAHDPLYADAYLGIAESYAILGANDQAPASLVFPQARAAARHALDLNGNSAEAHATLAHISEFYDWDFPLAEQEFQRALQLDPSLAEAHHWYGLALLYQGRLSEAAQQIQAARDLDPLSILPSLALARVYFYGGDYDRSLQLSREMLQFDDQYSLTHNSLGQAYEWKGDYRQAISEFQQYEVLSKGDTDALLNLGETYALMGDQNRALGIVGNLLQDKSRYVSPYGYAEIYAILGNTQQAYQWLETSVNQHSASCMMLLVDPAFRKIRDQPRFEEFLRRTGHPAEAPRDILAKMKFDLMPPRIGASPK